MRRLFFSPRPELDQPETQQNVFLIALYALTITSAAVIPVNLLFDLSRADPLSLGFQALFLACLVAAVAWFLFTRRLGPSRLLTAAGLFVLAAYLLLSGGGSRGIGYLYFLAAFPLVYLVLGLRWGLVFIGAFLVGVIAGAVFDAVPPGSLLADPELRPRLVLVFSVAGVMAACGLIYQNSLVQDLSALAYSDAVTGLASRNRMVEDLDRAVGGPRPFALLALKLHHFGLVSNHLGMAPGDEALKATADRLREVLPPDSLAGRWTGTLFVVRVPATQLDRLEELGRSVLAAVSLPVELEGEHLQLQPGVAITRFPEEGRTVDRLVANLSTTLARGEDQPGQVLLYDEAAWKAEERKFRVAAALELAVAQKELSLAYQPKVVLEDGKPHGAEILVRWTNGDLGPVSPAEFIPVAETLGLIHPITWFVVDQFLADMGRFPDRNALPGPFALNLSSQDLMRRDFAVKLVDRFKKAGVPPASVELEITEGVMMSQDPHLRGVLNRLKNAGFRLAIDDFGTGYSSLSYLHRIDADTLKIDQSFIRQLDASQAMPTIVDAIISMGLALNLEIVAEGVETEEQARYLKARGCTLAQGWLFSKPQPFDAYRKWLEAQPRSV